MILQLFWGKAYGKELAPQIPLERSAAKLLHTMTSLLIAGSLTSPLWLFKWERAPHWGWKPVVQQIPRSVPELKILKGILILSASFYVGAPY